MSAVNATGADPFSVAVEGTTAEDGEYSLYALCVCVCVCAECMQYIPEIIETKNCSLYLYHTAPDGAPRGLTDNSTGPTTVTLTFRTTHWSTASLGLLMLHKKSVYLWTPCGEATSKGLWRAGLQPYTTYQFRVRVVNEVGEGPFSNPVVIITLEDGKWGRSNCRKFSK